MKIYLSLGSNIGDRLSNLKKACQLLEEKGILILRKSSFYLTQPWGIKNQPEFINQVIEAETSLPPEELLTLLKEIEGVLGRKKGKRWGPRIIDIDILFYGDEIIRKPDLIIPHPLLQERAFVLIPLCEISPSLMHPILKKKIVELVREVKKEGVRKWEEKV